MDFEKNPSVIKLILVRISIDYADRANLSEYYSLVMLNLS